MTTTEQSSGRRSVVAQLVWSLDTGGLERVVVDLVSRLDAARFQSVVYCLEGEGALADEVREACLDVVSLGKRPGIEYGLPFRLARLLRRHRVDVVHCHNYGPLLYGTVAGRLARVRGVVYTAHGAEAPSRRAHVTLQRLGLVHEMVAVSNEQRRLATDMSGVDPRRITTIHNGIDIGRYARPDSARRSRARAQIGLSDSEAAVGVVARLAPEKDHATLLAAFRRVAETHPSARLVVVGDGELRGALVAMTEELGIAGAVVFLGTRRDVPDLLAAFDVFVLPSKVEGLGITLLEAMASGLATVSTRAGGIPEIVVDGETGVMVPVGDHVALADAIRWVLDHPGAAAEMGRKGRERVEREFSLDRAARRYEEIYARLTKRRRSRATRSGRRPRP